MVPREIASWLTLSVLLCGVLLGAAIGYALVNVAASTLGPSQSLIAALLIGAALQFVTRAYHSGAYALRRVYRPLPSLFVLDVVSVGVLLVAWPFVGIWAFPLSELISVLSVTAVTLHYTTRTYRTLALPTIMPLLRERRPIPSTRTLRKALAPGVSYAFVGLEALVVIAGTASISTGAATSLVILLAVLAPVSRAGFEWARLLYFDLKRIDVPLLRGLSQRFDAASRRVALVMGGVTWAFAAVGVLIVGGLSWMLLLALLVLFVARSLLASAQIQAFSRDSFTRLTLVGVAGVIGLVAAFTYIAGAELQLFAVGAVLAISFVVLLVSATDDNGNDSLLSMPDWLRQLSNASGPVSVTRLGFDARVDVRGVTVEARRAEQARRDAVAERIARRVGREHGAATWFAPTELWLFATGAKAAAVDAEAGKAWHQSAVALAGGLVDRPPVSSGYPSGIEAAHAMANIATGGAGVGMSAAAVITDFAGRFPDGIAYDMVAQPPAALKRLPADVRGDIYREAITFASELKTGRLLAEWEVTSLSVDGVLRAVFAVERTADERERKTWRRLLRNWMLQASVGVGSASGESAVTVPTVGEARML